jgi:protein TonB
MSPAPAAEQAGPPLPAVPPKGPTAESARRIIEDYPDSALRAKQEGDVTLSMCVSAEGRATDVKVIRSSGVKVLDDAAIRAVPKLRCKRCERAAPISA